MWLWAAVISAATLEQAIFLKPLTKKATKLAHKSVCVPQNRLSEAPVPRSVCHSFNSYLTYQKDVRSLMQDHL